MSNSALALLLAVLCAPAAAWADGGHATQHDHHAAGPTRVAAGDDGDDDDGGSTKARKPKGKAKADDADDDDSDGSADSDDDSDDDDQEARDAKKAWRGKHPKQTGADAGDDDSDSDDGADSDDDDDDKPAHHAKPAKKVKHTDDADDSDDADSDDSADSDDDDDKPAHHAKPAKKVKHTDDADDDDDSADSDDADDDSDDDRPAHHAKPVKKVKHTDDADDDDDSDDSGTRHDALEDDDDDSPLPKVKKKPAAASSDDDTMTLNATPQVVDEVYITPPKIIAAGEVLGAKPIDSANSDLFGMGGGIAIGLEYGLSAALALHAGGEYLYLRQGDGMSTTSWASVSIGPRLHFGSKVFGAGTHNDAWLDAHVEYGSSGGIRRPGFDVGAALAWEVSPAFRVGPMVRWAFGSDPLDKNAQLVTVGLAVGIGGRTRSTIHIEGDADGDGLVDRLDPCPGEFPGDHPDPKRPGCAIKDGDGDGVADDADECPEEAAGDDPDPDRDGCPKPPIADRDQDTVPDDEDNCPDEAGPARPGEESNGCPLARVQDQKIEILEQIFFENDSATISDQSRPVLEAIAKVIASLDDKHISIEGHTDEVGTDAYNMDLSKRRARAVAQWLIENAGISSTRLEVKGWGKRRPLVSGHGADTSKNRRVEFLILDDK